MKLARCLFAALMLAAVTLQSVPSFAELVIDTAWVRTYNGDGNIDDWAFALAVDSAGNVYVTGRSGGTNYDYATVKYYPEGDTAWVRRYDGPATDQDEAYAIAVDASGNVYVTGYSIGNGTSSDYATFKYSPEGDTAWLRRYNGPGDAEDAAFALAVDDSGSVYVAGGSVGSGTSSDYATIKYYASGDTAWLRRYNGPGDSFDGVYDLTVDGSGNVYVTGYSSQTITFPHNYDYATIKYYSTGDTAWVRRYNGTADGEDEACAVAIDASGNVYVTGYSEGSGTGRDYATVKYYPNGDTAWARRYDNQATVYDDEAKAIAVDDSGNVYVTGYSRGSGTYYDYATIKYHPDGDTAWVRRYNGPGNSDDVAFAIAVDGSGDVYVTGYSYGSETGSDYATIRYYSDGETAWIARYDGPGSDQDQASAIAVDASGNVYVTGYSVGSGTSSDYATIKYMQYDSIPFAPAVSYEAADCPHSVFCGDLDGDGDLDLAIANIYSNDVSIFKNNGNGTFETKADYGAGNFARSVFCADLDGDADLDLAVANSESHDVSILINNGDTSFQTKVDYATGQNPISVFCADLDGDLDIDLAVPNSGTDSVSIFKNNGDGTFQTKVNYAVGDWPHSVFCADLDGDSDLDLAVANRGDNNVSILKNNGNGTFQTKVDYGVGSEPHHRSVFCADLDGDMDMDLAVANSGSDDVSILKNNGDGTFETKVDYDVGDRPYSVFCADLDGDTCLDLALANSLSANVSILKNNGDGTFQTKADYGVGIPLSAFCADLDGDADADLVVASGALDSVSILKNLTQVPANQPPWVFSLISPEDEDTTLGTTTFQWHIPYDPNFGDQMRYDLHTSTSPGFELEYTDIDSNLSVSKHTKAMREGTYFWKVKAEDNWGAETWSSETWSFAVRPRSDTLWITAFSPVDLVVTDPVEDSIGIDFNTIPDADYDTTVDVNDDGDKDDLVTIPNPYVGEYLITVLREADAADDDTFSIGIRVDGGTQAMLAQGDTVPPPGEMINYSYDCPAYLRGDLNKDNQTDVADVILLINYLFIGGSPPDPPNLGDVNCDDSVDVSDALYLINYLFLGTSAPCS